MYALVSSSIKHEYTHVCMQMRLHMGGGGGGGEWGAALIPRTRGVRAARAEGWGRVLLKQCPAGPSAMPVRLQPHGHYPPGLSVADWAGRRDML